MINAKSICPLAASALGTKQQFWQNTLLWYVVICGGCMARVHIHWEDGTS